LQKNKKMPLAKKKTGKHNIDWLIQKIILPLVIVCTLLLLAILTLIIVMMANGTVMKKDVLSFVQLRNDVYIVIKDIEDFLKFVEHYIKPHYLQNTNLNKTKSFILPLG